MAKQFIIDRNAAPSLRFFAGSRSAKFYLEDDTGGMQVFADGGRFDVLIVGGGINGAVAAAVLSSRGAKVALVDRGDFAGFTSQESSNLVWGGFKYLENYELPLVFGLCRSRNRLMKAYPDNIKEIGFLAALDETAGQHGLELGPEHQRPADIGPVQRLDADGIPGGHEAAVLALAPGGPTWFVVDRDTPGFTHGKPEDKHGIRASNTAALSLQDVRVGVDRVVGEVEGQGLQQAQAVFGYTRLMVAAFGLGAGWAALDRAIEYSTTRIQGGAPLSEKQGYTHKLIVPNVVHLEAARAYVEETAVRLDAGEGQLNTEGAIAKYMGSVAVSVLPSPVSISAIEP